MKFLFDYILYMANNINLKEKKLTIIYKIFKFKG